MSEQDHNPAATPSEQEQPTTFLQGSQEQPMVPQGRIDAGDIRADNVVSGVQLNIEHQEIYQVVPPPAAIGQTPPFMAADLPVEVVARPQEFEKLKQSLLVKEWDRSTSRVVALYGAGGYGKTTLALALCHDPDIQATFHDGILWVTLGEKSVNVVAKMEELVKLLRGEQLGLISVEAARTKLKDALAGRSCLLVIDDVWRSADLTPFLQGGPQCARLVTTRDDRVIPMHAVRIQVDAMNQNEAVQLLKTGLVSSTQALEPTFQRLAAQLGEWPLLLTLANGVLRRREQRGEPLQSALDHLQRDLKRRGVVAFDARNADARSEAVEKTIEVSLEQLTTDEAARYGELAIFPEDTSVPLSAVWCLWQTTGGWDDWKTENLCELLASLSLLHYDPKVGSIRLHDVVRNYLQVKIRPHLSALQRQFLDSYSLRRWSDLSLEEPYLWYHLAEHLIAAEQREILFATMKELGYLGKKTLVYGVSATEQDLALAVDHLPNEKTLVLLRRHIVRNAHLLGQGQTLGEVEAVLLNYCSNIEDGGILQQEWEREITSPYLTAWHPFPNPSSDALVRTLWGHILPVNGCVISADGRLIVSASDDRTLKVWETQTGEEHLTLRGHEKGVRDCAISADGRLIVSASDDTTLKVWDAQTGEELRTLSGHRAEQVLGCAISADGRLIISASDDKTLKIWETQTGEERHTLSGHHADTNLHSKMPF
jgi:hypothetical protein